MTDPSRAQQELLEENSVLKQRIQELEQSESDRKLAEEALRNSEVRLRTLVQTIPDIIWLKDKDGVYLSCNTMFERFFGAREADIIGKTDYDFVNRELANIFREHDLKTMATGKSSDKEDWITFADDGHRALMAAIKTPMYDAQGTLIGVLGIGRDITARKLAEEALHESESSIRAITDSAQDAILMMDPEGRISYWNPAAERILGYTSAEAIGQDLHTLIVPSRYHEAHHAAFPVFQQKGQGAAVGETLDLEARRKDGKEISVQLSLSAIHMKGAWHAMGVLRDSTERKEIEAGLEETRKELEVIKKAADEVSEFAESLINTVREPLITLDQDLRVVTASRSFYEFFKVNPEETVGQLIYDLGNKQWDIPKLRELLETILPEKATFDNYEVEHEFATIGRRIMLLNARQIQQVLGKERIILLAIEDITERKRAEEVIKNNMVFQQVLMDAVPSPIFYKDAACVYIGGNKAFERYLGLSPEQFVGKTVYDISPANLAEKYDEADRELLNNPGVQNYEASVVYADGTRHDVVFNKATFTNAEGKIAGLIGAILDITERKRAEKELRDSENRLHTLVQTIPDLIWLKDKDGVYLSCNPMFGRFFGAREADIVGKTDYDFVNRELADAFREHDNKAMVAGKTTSNEEWISFADDGHRVFLDTTKTPMYDAQGALIGVLGIGRDITDRMSVDRIRKALGGTVQAIAVTVEARDPYTAGHQRRVADLARAIATEMNLPIDIIDGIRMAAAIHDLGKISVPAEILSKPTKLKKTEFDLIKDHPQSGYDILKDIDFPWPVARIVLEHHERTNGSGYPNGLTGDNILMESRIIAVADVVESMGSHRPYRPSLGIEAALEEIERNKGTFYDNTVADACLRLFREKGFQLAQA